MTKATLQSDRPMSREEAYEAGVAAARDGTAPVHDLTRHMRTIGIPAAIQGRWLAGYEDEITGGREIADDSDGYGWERRALAGIA